MSRPMGFETLLYDVADAVATITLNRSERLNTIVPPMHDELEAAVHRAVADPAVKVIVLRGAGRAFCAGFDFGGGFRQWDEGIDRKSTRLNSSHANISYAVFCLKKKKERRKT